MPRTSPSAVARANVAAWYGPGVAVSASRARSQPSLVPLEQAVESVHRSLSQGAFGDALPPVPVRLERLKGRWSVLYRPRSWSDGEREHGELVVKIAALEDPIRIVNDLAHQCVHQRLDAAGQVERAFCQRYHDEIFADAAREVGFVPPSHREPGTGFGRLAVPPGSALGGLISRLSGTWLSS